MTKLFALWTIINMKGDARTILVNRQHRNRPIRAWNNSVNIRGKLLSSYCFYRMHVIRQPFIKLICIVIGMVVVVVVLLKVILKMHGQHHIPAI